ncbi:protein unc-13 homolog [Juglans microcarpa x Juglans regia]|uniref:protein unc-13 homolog n=1 Tax=Juglans microcarpa x Juglans regia TaxID=2249226 RepID=UPI001B7E8D63|nr:protein unc-13 homolog [Juglans microcarpa x Juglans regia]
MSHHTRRESLASPHIASRPVYHEAVPEEDLAWSLGKLAGIDRHDIRETAYEVFFTACRSSPGFGGRNPLTFYSSNNQENNGDGLGINGPKQYGVVMSPTSRVKRALGLKTLKRSPSKRMASGLGGSGSFGGSNPSSPIAHGSQLALSFTVPQPMRPRRPMTSAEIMRQQMRVTEQSDIRLRKTLLRTLIGQVGRRAETIILPLELLRHLKPAEFNDSREYHLWQKRQLKILEAGLLLHPPIPLDKSNTFAMRLRDIVLSGERKPIDTGKNSDTMRTLCDCVIALSWRSASGTPTDVCHWADGFPLNIHLYIALLQSAFDIRDETLVLDEVDELFELIKKTWSTLGITRPMHNVCFTWVLFQQYVVTAQIEPDLLCASHAMLVEVANDAKRPNREPTYVKILSSVLTSMKGWAEKRLLNYHDYFHPRNVGQVENLLPLVLTASNILGKDVIITEGAGREEGDQVTLVDSSGDGVDHYIRSSLKNAFYKIVESGNIVKSAISEEKQDASEALLQLAKETEDLALKERESFSPILKRWHPTAVAVAAVTLHSCYGSVLKQYLGGVSMLTTETVGLFQRTGKLEKFLVQMVVEDSAECADGGKAIVREMVPYEVDSIILNLLKNWMDEKLKKGKECIQRAKETETWNPKSKSDPYAQSAVDLMMLAQETANDFFEIPIEISEDSILDLAYGLESQFQDYVTFVASCGSKQSYIPTLPALTRCNRDSKFLRLWKKASPCNIGAEELHKSRVNEGYHPRPSTSRGTQRLYIRLNTLHYLLFHLHSLDKILSFALSQRIVPSTRKHFATSLRSNNTSYSYFELACSSIQEASKHVSDVAAHRLIFLDSKSVFYDSLYVDDVANARIRPALRILKQNLTLMTSILTDRAQALAIREVMKASFKAYLMVLLAGGSSRVFYWSDHAMIEEDFKGLKRVFCTCGEGLIAEEVVEREAKIVEGVITLMGQFTEQLVEDFNTLTCETCGSEVVDSGQKLAMPPTTGKWNRSDPNTILRVLCHRNDSVANQFLKRTFHLAKRR